MHDHAIPSVSVDELHALPSGASLIDVREDDEWAAGHIGFAEHIPLGEIERRVGDIVARNGDEPVYVVCKLGGRSARAVEFLRSRDVNAINVEGGTDAWRARGFEVSTAAAEA